MYKIFSKKEERFLDNSEAIVTPEGDVFLVETIVVDIEMNESTINTIELVDKENHSVHLFSGYHDKNGVELYEGDKVKDGRKTATIVRQSDGAFRLQQKNVHGTNYNSRIHEDVLIINKELADEV